jgi:hypothetical protein
MRNFIVSIYYVKAAELNVIRRTAVHLLRGLNFVAAYTPHFAMCTDNLSEIMLATNTDAIETRSVMRFSCSGICSRPEMKTLRAEMDGFCRHNPETVGLWCEKEPDYFDKAATKASQALKKTFKEISSQYGTAFNVMVINNDILPMLELIASKDYDLLEIARPGEVAQFRYEVAVGIRNILNWRLLHAYKFNLN